MSLPIDPRITRPPRPRVVSPSPDARIEVLDATVSPVGIERRSPPPGTVRVLLEAGLGWLYDEPATVLEARRETSLGDATVLRALWWELAYRTYRGDDYHAYVEATMSHAVALLAGARVSCGDDCRGEAGR